MEIDLVVMNGNLYKVVIGVLFTICVLYVIDPPKHVRQNPMTWEDYVEWNMLNYELSKY